MQITEITASWSETANLGNYSNVRPSLTLKATLEPGEYGTAHIVTQLMAQCKAFVQEQVDQALEAEGQAAKYSQEPRFDVIIERYGTHSHIVIVPAGMRFKVESRRMYPSAKKFRLAAARAYAQQKASEYMNEAEQVVAFYDASVDTLALEAAVLDITEAKAAFEAEREALRLKQEADWEQARLERERIRERDRLAYQAANARNGALADNEDEEADDEDDGPDNSQ